MAQQLRQTEEQYIKALRLWQCAQEEEKRKVQEKFLERQKAAVLGKVRRLQGKLIQSRRQIQQLRQELNEERENGQMDAGSAAAAAAAAAASASSKEASTPQPENRSTSSSSCSRQETENVCLELLSTSCGFPV
ncbi:hypothetical protein HGM15179_020716 [Zosterops borbonicus]|uniref:Uncharacterized protein n=1 Tax=Zosterops borbonicus TaxID=364589 RepID=A0A8K1D9T8_9PASS|nr:hypothetical protein HGM15179_020716 [Zosterops borbonicus]